MRMRQLELVGEAPSRSAVPDLPRPVPAYNARELSPHDAPAFDAALRLRQTVFAHELAWVPPGPDGRERDRCDALAHHFAVFASSDAGHRGQTMAHLVAYARVLLPADGLMLEREFAELLGGQPLLTDRARSFEVSRLVVDGRWRGVVGHDRRGAAEHLGRAIAHWAAQRGRTELLSVCEVRHARALRLRGLAFARFGRVVEYQAGVPVCAVRLSLPQAAARLRRLRPADHAWYQEGIGD